MVNDERVIVGWVRDEFVRPLKAKNRLKVYLGTLTHFMPLVSFYSP